MRSHTANSSRQRVSRPPTLPPRPKDGHKGLFGRVLIVGGNAEMIGAPILAGSAALRTGSGLVQVAMPAEVLAAGLSICPELIGLGLKADDAHLLEEARLADALAVGPGMGKSPVAGRRVAALIQLNKPMVVDADALNYLASLKAWPRTFRAKAVLTPHPGEMRRLAKLFGKTEVPSDEAGRISMAREASSVFRQVVVLKGHQTVVADGQRYYVNKTGDSSLSKAGAGDVLSGILACLLGQNMSPFDAACAAVHLHGLAGEMAGRKLGRRSVLARDVIDEIGAAISASGG